MADRPAAMYRKEPNAADKGHAKSLTTSNKQSHIRNAHQRRDSDSLCLFLGLLPQLPLPVGPALLFFSLEPQVLYPLSLSDNIHLFDP